MPYIVSWPNGLPAGMTYTGPVSSLDIAATAVIAAGQATDDRLEGLDLVDLLAQVEGAATTHPMLEMEQSGCDPLWKVEILSSG